jgi:hypothetical protein
VIKHKNVRSNSGGLNLIEILLPCSIILSSYNLFGICMTYWILGIYAVFRIFFYKDRFYINKQLVIFLSFVSVNQVLLAIFKQGDSVIILKNLLEAILTTGVVIIISNTIRKDHIYKPYVFIGGIAMVGIFIQSFQVYVLGDSVVPIQIFPNLLGETPQWSRYEARPMSFFVEPQAYATFILPLLFMCLEKKNIRFAALITFSIMLCTSSLGIMMSAILWIMYIVISKLSIGKKLSVVLILAIFTVLLTQTSIFKYSFNKITTIDIDNNVRLSQGFEILLQMPVKDVITGIGEGTITDYIDEQGIWLERMLLTTNPLKWSYVTTISGSLIYYGLFGAALLCWMQFKMLRNKKSGMFTLALAIVALSFGQGILFNAWYILWYSIYFCFADKTYNRDYFIIGQRGKKNFYPGYGNNNTVIV